MLLGAAIDSGDSTSKLVKNVLIESAKGQHNIGLFGHHIIQAFLSCNDPECHRYISNMLKSAQREEEIRSSIISGLRNSVPEAFKIIAETILKNDLLRFKSIAEGINLITTGMWEISDQKPLASNLKKILYYLGNDSERKKVLMYEKGENLYLALWSTAFIDIMEAFEYIEIILNDSDPEKRYPAVHILPLTGIEAAMSYSVAMLQDNDMRIVGKAMEYPYNIYPYTLFSEEKIKMPEEYEEFFEKLPDRFPQKKTVLPAITWHWNTITLDIQKALLLFVTAVQKKHPEKIIPRLKQMNAEVRYESAVYLAKHIKKGGIITDAVFDLMGDPSAPVREVVFKAAKNLNLNEDQAKKMETLLKRKPGDLRKAVLAALFGQDVNAALHSAERLMNSADKMQRIGGLELLKRLYEKGRGTELCKNKAAQYMEIQKNPGKEELNSLSAILQIPETISGNTGESGKTFFAMPNPEDRSMGLLKNYEFVIPKIPQKRGVKVFTPATLNLLKSLGKFIEKHKETPVQLSKENRTILLGEISWGFPKLYSNEVTEKTIDKLPLRELWETWWKERPDNTRDEDGFELLRAIAYPYVSTSYWQKIPEKSIEFLKSLNVEYVKDLPYDKLIRYLLPWLLVLFHPEGAVDFLLDALEETIIHVKPEWCTAPQNTPKYEYGRNRSWLNSNFRNEGYNGLLNDYWCWFHYKCSKDQFQRFWDIEYWLANPMFEKDEKPAQPTEWLQEKHQKYCESDGPRIDQYVVITAFRLGFAAERDLIESFCSNFFEASGRSFSHRYKDNPRILAVVEKFRNRILEVEIKRGEDATAATPNLKRIKYTGSIDVLASFLGSLGKGRLLRGKGFDEDSRNWSFTQVIRNTFPPETEDYNLFEKRIKEENIAEKLLVETAMLAPQWAGYIEKYLGWKGFKSAVFWFHAHTKDDQWSADDDFYETWKAEINTYTPLDANSLKDGAVDAEWFTKVYKDMGEKHWEIMDEAGKYASSGNGHGRARTFANAISGKTTKNEIMEKINDKRNQDAVRALGLLPLPKGKKKETEIFERYETIQEFLRSSRKFGSQRQISEKRAVTIGLENLARTGSYPDPIRLEWAMETRAIGDLADGSMKVAKGEYVFNLRITPDGEPEFSINKGEKIIKSVPAAYKKDEDVMNLRAKGTELKKQVSRIRKSLEEAMIRQDEFTLEEVANLNRHPVLSAFFGRLILTDGIVSGLPADDGLSLTGVENEKIPVESGSKLRIAHSFDLLQSGRWSSWQKYFFQNQIKQPFRQVFRELYVLTDTEKQEKGSSTRYCGNSIQSNQSVAILSKRGWVVHPEEGIRKNLHRENITVHLNFSNYFYYYSGENEVWTVDSVEFTERGKWETLPWDKVSPITFSEIMRDLDLVVSVAHSGSYDPEATMSTVEMRLALVRETVNLLNFTNVKVTENRVLIEGKFGDYSVHPGSAAVHKMPGGHICIVPVESQKMDRIFLPFADSDQKTAELISKVLLLAEDGKIKSPDILNQITR
jgi:hypothetical protein